MFILKFINKSQIVEMSFNKSDIYSIPDYFEMNKTPFIVISSTGMVNPESSELFPARKWKYWRKETFLHKDWIE
jgi:hypothetical protein